MGVLPLRKWYYCSFIFDFRLCFPRIAAISRLEALARVPYLCPGSQGVKVPIGLTLTLSFCPDDGMARSMALTSEYLPCDRNLPVNVSHT